MVLIPKNQIEEKSTLFPVVKKITFIPFQFLSEEWILVDFLEFLRSKESLGNTSCLHILIPTNTLLFSFASKISCLKAHEVEKSA